MAEQKYWKDATDELLDQIFPVPSERIENPQKTVLGVGDAVKVLIGPATGKTGSVVVDRNGNYVDYEPNVSKDSIGVAVFERKERPPVVNQIVESLTGDGEASFTTAIRWFDSPDQLQLVKSAGEKKK